jgi:hypothetical protein
MQLSMTSLIAELRAIELWDHFYSHSNTRDAIDATAWIARRERQAAIYEYLFKQSHPEIEAMTAHQQD